MAQDWLHINPETGGHGTTAVLITADTNTNPSQRTAIIYFKAGRFKKQVKVVQGAAAGTITVSINPSQATLDYNTTGVTLTATASGSYEGTPSYSWSFNNLPSEVVASSTGSSACTLNYTGDVTSTTNFTATCTVTAGSVSGSGTSNITVEPKSSGQLTVSIAQTANTLSYNNPTTLTANTTNAVGTVGYIWSASDYTNISVQVQGNLLHVDWREPVHAETPITISVTATSATQTATTDTVLRLVPAGALTVRIEANTENLNMWRVGDKITLSAITSDAIGDVTYEWGFDDTYIGADYFYDSAVTEISYTTLATSDTLITITVTATTTAQPAGATASVTLTVHPQIEVEFQVCDSQGAPLTMLNWYSGESGSSYAKKIYGYGTEGAIMQIYQGYPEWFSYSPESVTLVEASSGNPQELFTVQTNKINNSGRNIEWYIQVLPINSTPETTDQARTIVAYYWASTVDQHNIYFEPNKYEWGWNESGSTDYISISAKTILDWYECYITGATATSQDFTVSVIDSGISLNTNTEPLTEKIRIYPNNRNLTTSDKEVSIRYSGFYRETTDSPATPYSGWENANLRGLTHNHYTTNDVEIFLSAQTSDWAYSATTPIVVYAASKYDIPITITDYNLIGDSAYFSYTSETTQVSSAEYVRIGQIAPTGNNTTNSALTVTFAVTASSADYGGKTADLTFTQYSDSTLRVDGVEYKPSSSDVASHFDSPIVWEWNEYGNTSTKAYLWVIGKNLTGANLDFALDGNVASKFVKYKEPTPIIHTIPQLNIEYAMIGYIYPNAENLTLESDGHEGYNEVPITATTRATVNGGPAGTDTFIIQDKPHYIGDVSGENLGYDVRWVEGNSDWKGAALITVDDSCIRGGTTAITDAYNQMDMKWGSSAGTPITTAKSALPAIVGTYSYSIWAKPKPWFDTEADSDFHISGVCNSIIETDSGGNLKKHDFLHTVTLIQEKYKNPHLVIYLGRGQDLIQQDPNIYTSISGDTIINGHDNATVPAVGGTYNVVLPYSLGGTEEPWATHPARAILPTDVDSFPLNFLYLTQTNSNDAYPIHIWAYDCDGTHFDTVIIQKQTESGIESGFEILESGMTFNGVVYQNGQVAPAYDQNSGIKARWDEVSVIGDHPITTVNILDTPIWKKEDSGNSCSSGITFEAPSGTYALDSDTPHWTNFGDAVVGPSGNGILMVYPTSAGSAYTVTIGVGTIYNVSDNTISANTALVQLASLSDSDTYAHTFIVSGYDKRVYVRFGNVVVIRDSEDLREELRLWPSNPSPMFDATLTLRSPEGTTASTTIQGITAHPTNKDYFGLINLPSQYEDYDIIGCSAYTITQGNLNSTVIYTPFGLLGELNIDTTGNNNNGNGDGDEGGGSTGEDTGGQT